MLRNCQQDDVRVAISTPEMIGKVMLMLQDSDSKLRYAVRDTVAALAKHGEFPFLKVMGNMTFK